jgi:hypothetical protein
MGEPLGPTGSAASAIAAGCQHSLAEACADSERDIAGEYRQRVVSGSSLPRASLGNQWCFTMRI